MEMLARVVPKQMAGGRGGVDGVDVVAVLNRDLEAAITRRRRAVERGAREI